MNRVFRMIGSIIAIAALAFVFFTATAAPAHAQTNPGGGNGSTVYIWGTNVNARYSAPLFGTSCYYYPSTSCAVEEHFTQQWVPFICQQQGQTVTAEGVTNNWWMLIQGTGQPEWVSNIYIEGGQTIAGVPFCNR